MKPSLLIQRGVQGWAVAMLTATILSQLSMRAQTLPCPETNGLKFIQLPQTQLGFDVYDSKGVALADDFLCYTPGPITDIHIWGSWLNDRVGTITNFWLGIYNDVPAVTNLASGQVTPSHPGTNLLWNQYFGPTQFSQNLVTNGDEYFFDPRTNNIIIGGDTMVFYYCFYPTNPFVQQGTPNQPTNYWLAAHAGLLDPVNYEFGWKTAITNYNDPASWVPAAGGMPIPNAPWTPIYSPLNTQSFLGLAFKLNTRTNPPVTCVETDTVKFVQGPNLNNGFDVWNSSTMPPGVTDGPWALADDFICTNTGPISDIHLWGSWYNDRALPGSITFWLGVYDDVPVNATNSFSRPGNLLWQQYFAPGQYAEMPFATGQESFLDPGKPQILGPESEVWYYCFYPNNLMQTGTVSNAKFYWLAVYAQLPAIAPQVFGWKTTPSVQYDISVHTPWPGAAPGGPWTPTLQAATGGPLDLAFKIDTVTNQCSLLINCPQSKTVQCGSSWGFDPPYATNPCCTAPPTVTFEGVVTNSTGCPQVYTASWLITDCMGDRGVCTQQVTVVDTTPPSLTVSSNIVVYSCTNVVVTWSVTATDACSSVTVTSSPPSGSPFPPNTTNTITVTATDACGNTTNGTFTVAIICSNTNPPITCVETGQVKYVQVPNLNNGFDVWNCNIPLPGDTNKPWVLADDFVCTNSGPITDIHLWGSWLADQPLTNSITFWLGIYDDAPTNANNPFSHPGTNLIWQQYFSPGQYAETFFGTGQETFLDPGPPQPFGPESQVWYYCFNPTNLNQTGTESLPRTYWLAAFATLPAGVADVYGWKTTTNVQHDISVHAPWPGAAPVGNPGWLPTFQSAAGGPLDLAFKIVTSTNPPVQCVETDAVKYVQGPNLVGGSDVWNSSSKPSFVTDGPWVLADDFVCTNTGPISDIHIWGSWLNDAALPGNITFWLGIYSDVPPNPVGTNYSQPGNLIWQQTFTPGQYAELLYAQGQEYFLDPGPPADIGADTYVWYYCFYPTNLVQYGSVTNPTIYWLSVFAQLPPGTTNIFGWKTTTNVFNDISVHAQWPGITPPNTPWTPNLLPTGLPVDLAFKISTVTNRCPIPVACPVNKTVQCGSSWGFDPPVIGPDPCCPGPPQTNFVVFTNSIAPCQQVYSGVWTITDCFGQMEVCTQVVTVVDTTPPVITCSSNKTVECGTAWSFDPPTAVDACCGTNVTISILGTTTNGSGCPSIITRTWIATDCCTNSSTCTQTVTVVDTTPPSLIVPSNMVLYTCGTNAVTNWSITATDVCSSVTVTSSPSPPASFLPDTTNTVSVTATDQCGNSTNKTFTITVLRPTLTSISIQYLATNKVVLTWSNGILESATNVLGPYLDVSGATSPYTNTTSGSAQFYRLRCDSP